MQDMQKWMRIYKNRIPKLMQKYIFRNRWYMEIYTSSFKNIYMYLKFRILPEGWIWFSVHLRGKYRRVSFIFNQPSASGRWYMQKRKRKYSRNLTNEGFTVLRRLLNSEIYAFFRWENIGMIIILVLYEIHVFNSISRNELLYSEISR